MVRLIFGRFLSSGTASSAILCQQQPMQQTVCKLMSKSMSDGCCVRCKYFHEGGSPHLSRIGIDVEQSLWQNVMAEVCDGRHSSPPFGPFGHETGGCTAHQLFKIKACCEIIDRRGCFQHHGWRPKEVSKAHLVRFHLPCI